MAETEIIERIRQLCQARGWSYYRLAKESGIPYSTLCTMLHKSNAPSIPTLIKLCEGFGITLGAFFDTGSQRPVLTQEEADLLRQWAQLSERNQASLMQYLQFLLSRQEME